MSDATGSDYVAMVLIDLVVAYITIDNLMVELDGDIICAITADVKYPKLRENSCVKGIHTMSKNWVRLQEFCSPDVSHVH